MVTNYLITVIKFDKIELNMNSNKKKRLIFQC